MNKPLNENLAYLNGQIDALTAVVLAVANLTLHKHQFRTEALNRLGAVESALLTQPVPEERLLAVEHMKAWIANVTA